MYILAKFAYICVYIYITNTLCIYTHIYANGV